MGCAVVQYQNCEKYKNNADFARLIICVDEADGVVIKGRVYSAFLHSEHPFYTLEQVISLAEQVFDLNSFPQASFGKRYFRTSSEKQKINRGETMGNLHVIDEKQLQSGEKGTFVVRVMFRQCATWQGTVSWVEGNKTQNFRSMLELVHLMEDALGVDDVVWESAPEEEV